ncbi:MAG: phosphate/phosphite/phosphonate ABC transporter substrate-binding protein [Labilithrix sp.]|nr:phosphate/phosphite/phosphonate ABC transporter substrate-binding protein [Labilithrix sp.]MCW5837114.1 phosphate/phosphite/phosphonate ABC transporter substrate-binding protein [Labilithrix sp.]
MTVWGFGIVQTPELDRAGRAAFDALCELVSEATEVRFRSTIWGSYRELSDAIEAGEVGLAWLPPLPAIDLEERGVASALAIPARNGATTYHSALIVRRGGPRSIEELRGRRAVWVERDSAAGYLVPRMRLAAQGIDVLRYFTREIFIHSHAGVVDAVVHGEADVGATYCHVDPSNKVVRGAWMDDDRRSLRPIDVLATFGPIPNDALVGSNELSAPTRSSLTRWLLGPSPRARELFRTLLGGSDFRVPTHAHYDPLKHMARAARARGHDAGPSSSRMGIRVARRRS